MTEDMKGVKGVIQFTSPSLLPFLEVFVSVTIYAPHRQCYFLLHHNHGILELLGAMMDICVELLIRLASNLLFKCHTLH